MAGLRTFYGGNFPEVGSEIELDAAEGKHLSRVLRARVGEAVEVLNGRGAVAQAVFPGESGKTVCLLIQSVASHPQPSPGITLLQGIPKGKTLDTILRQATEIGVERIIPVMSERSEVRLKGERLKTKTEHWRALLREAGKQSGNPWLPELVEPCDLPEAVGALKIDFGIVASLEPDSQPFLSLLNKEEKPAKTTLAVGPEGDFSAREYQCLRDGGFQPVRLGQQVLKCDTAALYCLSALDGFYAPR